MSPLNDTARGRGGFDPQTRHPEAAVQSNLSRLLFKWLRFVSVPSPTDKMYMKSVFPSHSPTLIKQCKKTTDRRATAPSIQIDGSMHIWTDVSRWSYSPCRGAVRSLNCASQCESRDERAQRSLKANASIASFSLSGDKLQKQMLTAGRQ